MVLIVDENLASVDLASIDNEMTVSITSVNLVPSNELAQRSLV